MKKINENEYVLTAIELAALCQASIEHATSVWQRSDWDSKEDATPLIVSRAHQLLYGVSLYEDKK